MSGAHLSKEFFELIKNIGESKSKQEEDRIMRNEVSLLKAKLNAMKKVGSKPVQMSKKRQKEFLVRLLYVEMLGLDGSFGYIKAVEMVASENVAFKRLGYLVCGACLPPEHEFRFMLINQLQRDLQSSHVLETSCALIALGNLATVDMIAAVSNFVIQALEHGSDMIRKKAIHALYKCYQMDSSVVTKDELASKLRKILCDRDPGVMGASLGIIETLAKANPIAFKDLVSSLVSILKQIIEHRLPREYDYHKMPAPWMQMSILRILRILGKADVQASQGMYEIVGDCMKRADIGVNVGYAVVYECVRTITNIYPNNALLEAAAEAISRFISSKNHNLKYLGVTGLAAIVESHPQYASAHQLAVMDCLESPDITLAHRTLELLYRMTNPHNVEFIVEKLVDFLRGGQEYHSDEHLQRNLTFKIANLAERFAPSNEWYVETITQLLEISGDIPSCKTGLNKVGNQLMQLIAEGEGGGEDDQEFDDSADISLRRSTVNTYITILLSSSKPILQYPDIFIQIMSWILGEYGYLADKMTVEGILERISQLILKKDSSAISDNIDLSASKAMTTRYLFNAIFKLVAQAGSCPPVASNLIKKYMFSHDVELQQRCVEFDRLLTVGSNVMGDILPIDASCEDLSDEIELDFLDDYVQEKLNSGASPYSPVEYDDDDYLQSSSMDKPAFNMTPYAKPPPTSAGSIASKVYNPNTGNASSASQHNQLGSNYSSTTQQSSQPPTDANGQPTLNLRNAANVWGKNTTSSTFNKSNTDSIANQARVTSSTVPQAGIVNMQGSVGVPYEPEKPQELTEREKMASALFGGVGGAPAAKPNRTHRAKKSVKEKEAVAAPISTKKDPEPEPEPVMDLLDMTSFGDSLPQSEPDIVPSNDIDIFGDTAPNSPLEASIPEPIPETVLEPPEPVADPIELPPPATTVPVLDPFAEQGLIDDIGNKPLSGFGETLVTSKPKGFTYNGSEISPLILSTPEFGHKWGSVPFLNQSQITNSSANDLVKFMKVFSDAGFHPIETIPVTAEGICAANVGNAIALVHGKLTESSIGPMISTNIEISLKATDMNLGDSLVTFLSEKLK